MNTSIKLHVLLPALCMGLTFLLHGALKVAGTPSGRGCVKTQTDATALSRGDSRPLLAESQRILRDATGLPRGVSRLLLLVHELAIAGAGSAMRLGRPCRQPSLKRGSERPQGRAAPSPPPAGVKET